MRGVIAIVLLIVFTSPSVGQTHRPPARKPAAPPQAAPKKEAPEMTCPAPLGVGVKTKIAFCDVMTGRDPAGGVLIKLPPHRGPVTLTFDLHNRHMYSEEQVKSKRAFARYTATIGVLTMDNTLISRRGCRVNSVPLRTPAIGSAAGAGAGAKAWRPPG